MYNSIGNLTSAELHMPGINNGIFLSVRNTEILKNLTGNVLITHVKPKKVFVYYLL